MLENGKKIIFIHLSFKNELKAFSDEYIGDIYKPMEWVRTVGRHHYVRKTQRYIKYQN
jgi:hypothetical protein